MNQKTALKKKDNNYLPLEKTYFSNNKTELLDPFAFPVNTSPKKMTATVVIPGRNVKNSILSCLASIEQSSFNIKYRNRLQVVVVDDGSNDGTWECIKKSRFSLNLTVLKQKHFGQAQALNTGIAVAENEIIISCDADMILSYYSIENFIRRHELFPHILLTGFRSDISGDNILVNENYIRTHGVHRYTTITQDERIRFPIPGYPDNMCLTSNHYKNLGYLRGLWMRKNSDPWLLSDLVVGALFSLPKSIYKIIGGYDERLLGYGCTDGYLASKAISVGCFVIPVYAASGLHIHHQSRTENKEREYKNNRRLFYKFLQISQIEQYPNWLGGAKKRIIESYTPTPLPKQKLIETKDSTPEYHMIDTLLALGKFTQAYNLLFKRTVISDLSVSIRLAKIHMGLHNYAEAIKLFKLAPDKKEVAMDIANAQAANGSYKQANKTFVKFALENPTSPLLEFWNKKSIQKHLGQGIKFFNQGFFSTAIRCFENVLICDPKNNTAIQYIKRSELSSH